MPPEGLIWHAMLSCWRCCGVEISIRLQHPVNNVGPIRCIRHAMLSCWCFCSRSGGRCREADLLCPVGSRAPAADISVSDNLGVVILEKPRHKRPREQSSAVRSRGEEPWDQRPAGSDKGEEVQATIIKKRIRGTRQLQADLKNALPPNMDWILRIGDLLPRRTPSTHTEDQAVWPGVSIPSAVQVTESLSRTRHSTFQLTLSCG